MDTYDEAAKVGARLDSALSVDPTARGRLGSLAELRILSFVFDCPEDMIATLVREDGSAVRQIPLSNPLVSSEGRTYINRVTRPNGTSVTEVDFTEQGKGIYAIDPDTGKTVLAIDGKERRVGPIRQYRFANMLGRLAIDY